MNADIQEIRKRRLLFIQAVYEAAGGNRMTLVDSKAIAHNLSLPNGEVTNIINYLSGEGLLKRVTFGGGIQITHRGVVEVENGMERPDIPTEHFPAVSVINVGTMIGSQIQQNAVQSRQVNDYSESDLNAVANIVSKFEQAQSNLGLSPELMSESEAEIKSLRAQLESPRPKKAIIAESLKSIKAILEGIGGNIIAAKLLELLSTLS